MNLDFLDDVKKKILKDIKNISIFSKNIKENISFTLNDVYKRTDSMKNKNKFYEYIMKEFYEIKENETFEIDRENLYYYNEKDIYAIFDLKNAKLYYFTPGIFISKPNYNSI